MKALVTGDRGFIGRHFVNFLKGKDWEVYGLDIKNGADEDALRYFISDDDEMFDLVIHCAYDVGGRERIDGTNMALATNVALDSAMFQWALNGGARAVIYYSSSAAYPAQYQSEEYRFRMEEDFIDHRYPLPPDADYGWAKLTGERLAMKAQDLGLRVHILRPFSGYGSDQGLEYPFPSIVKRAMQGSLQVWGPPGQTRDWIHVDDVIEGTWAIYEADEQRPVNLCTGIGMEMGHILTAAREAYLRLSGETGVISGVEYLRDMPTGVFYRVGDPFRMRQHYIPRISIDEGIERAIRDYLGR